MLVPAAVDPPQDARKGILFENFPPVLQLQLKRFEYDCMRDTMVKASEGGAWCASTSVPCTGRYGLHVSRAHVALRSDVWTLPASTQCSGSSMAAEMTSRK